MKPNVCPLCGAKECTEVHAHAERAIYQCAKCHVQFLYPMPTDEELTNIYSREYYKAWGVEESEAHAATRDMKMATFNRNLDIIQRSVAGGAVLDLGCATGFFLEAARERGFVPYGVEFSPFAAEVAREKFGAQNIFEGTVENSPFPPHSFDVITMSDFIEHVRDPVAVLRKARELLKPGGVILITTPDYHTFSRILMGEKWTHYKEEHLYYFDPISLRYAAQKAGLSIMRYARAQKALNLLYAYSQFNTYQHWLFTPLAKILCAITPSAIMKKNFYVSMGELSATLQ